MGQEIKKCMSLHSWTYCSDVLKWRISKNLYLSRCIKQCLHFRIPVHIVLLETHFHLKYYLKNSRTEPPCAGEGVLSVSLLSLKLRVIHSRVNDFSAADTTQTIVCLWHSEGRRENAISVFVSPVRGHSLALLHVHLLSHNLFSPLSLFLIYRHPHTYSICLIPADHASEKYLKLDALFSIVHCGWIVYNIIYNYILNVKVAWTII